MSGDRMKVPCSRRGRREEFAVQSSVALVRFKPEGEVLRRDDDGFAMMQAPQIRSRRCRQDRGGIDLAAVVVTGGFPKPRESEQRIVAAADRKGLSPFVARGFPFVKAVRRHEAPPALERRTKGRFFRSRFRARIDQRTPLDLLRPTGNEAPTHERIFTAALFGLPDHGNGLGRRDIVSRRKVVPDVDAQKRCKRRWRGFEIKTSAHGERG